MAVSNRAPSGMEIPVGIPGRPRRPPMPGVMPSAFLSRKLRNASGMPGMVDRLADGSLPAFPGGTPSPLLTAPVAGSTVKTREAWPAEDGLALVPAEPGHGPGVSVERWSPRNMRCNSALASLSRPSRVSRIAFSMSADILGSMAVILLPFRTGRNVGLPQRKTAHVRQCLFNKWNVLLWAAAAPEASEHAVGQRCLHRRTGLQCTEHGNGGDRRTGKLRCDVRCD